MSLSLIFSSIDIYITISNFASFGLNKPPNRWKHINSHISKLGFCSYCFFEKLSSKVCLRPEMRSIIVCCIVKFVMLWNPVLDLTLRLIRPVDLLLCSSKKDCISTYQDQFVKTRFPRIWSNRDMGIFSFWPISPQFA